MVWSPWEATESAYPAAGKRASAAAARYDPRRVRTDTATLTRTPMAQYVDGFLIPIPKKNLARYRMMAKLGAKIWKQKGALEYFECVGDDLTGIGTPFPKRAATKKDETVVFSWIVYKSRAHRDKVNKEVMKDPRMQRMVALMKDEKKQPFDISRMSFGGFKVLVKA